MHSPTASPWGSRASSPHHKRRAQGCAVTDRNRPMTAETTRTDTSWSYMPQRPESADKIDGTSNSRPLSRHMKAVDNNYEDHFPSNGFPSLPGSIEPQNLEPKTQPRLLGLESAMKDDEGSALAAKKRRAASKNSHEPDDDGKRRASVVQTHEGSFGGLLGGNGQVFFDVSAIKEQLKENMRTSAHAPRDYYWETGWFRWIAKHAVFENMTLLVIMLNAVWMGYDADQNDKTTLSESAIQFIIAENAFCVFFSFELIIRFGAFKYKRNCLADAWFVFDALLLVMMVFETWVLPSFAASGTKALQGLRWMRLIRLTRLARVARLLRAVPQLLIMVKAIIISLKTVSYTFVLLILMVYIFGVAFTILTEGNDEDFDGVLVSMNTLLLAGALPDQGDLVNRLRLDNLGYYVLIIMYLMIASLTLMNMLIGILTEVISGVAALEKEEMMLRSVKERLWAMLTELKLCTEDDDSITQEAFRSLVVLPKAAAILEEVDVDVVGLVDFADYIFSDEHPFLGFADFMDVVLQLRGSNAASVKDIVDLRKLVLKNSQELKALHRQPPTPEWQPTWADGRRPGQIAGDLK
eukprot:TRINITY_DN61636_c0_g1_i1.p1 TRINITY_DN61636_c0_g1~~TRINITY_DN61636_c0_g1_i1.p1  ORF type:complete len:656 (+),score=122.15 TRINITY_DN61636_c0_g1_i1:229-1968(+)